MSAAPPPSGSLAGRAVLVTGAGGFIGSHLLDRLVADGARVRAFVRYTSSAERGLQNVSPNARGSAELVFGDLRDPDAVVGAMRGIDVVFHLGALVAIPYSYVHPREVVETNVLGTLNVLMAARALETRRVVHTSTSEVYGTALYDPIDEAHPLQGQSPYAASKIGADKLAESFFRAYDLPLVTVRPFNTYGPRQSDRAIIPAIISQALARDEVRIGDPAPVRDFTHVSDTVDGFMRAALSDKVIGETLNLGSGAAVSIGELCETILGIAGRRVPVVKDPARLRPANSEVRRLLADSRKAQRLLGWAPRTSLDAGLRETVEWVRRHPERYTPDRYAL